MNPFKVLNKRRRRLLWKMLRGMKFNRESVEFLKNHVKWLKLDRDMVTAVPYPTNLMLELSARCNLHCVMCAREFRYGKEMDQGFLMAVINNDAARNFRRQWQSGKAPGFCKNCQFVDF